MDEASPDSELVARQLTVEPGRPTQIGDYANSIAIGEGGIWVAVHALEANNPEIVRLDPGTGDIVARISVTTIPGWTVGGGGMTVADGSLWVAGSIDKLVGLTRIDPSSNEIVETIHLERGSGADVWIDDSGIWVLAFVGGGGGTEVIRLDPVTREVVARIPLPASWAHQVLASNGSIWVHGNAQDSQGADVIPNTIYRIDPTTNEVVDSFELPSTDFPLAADDQAIWQRTRTGLARVDPAGVRIEVQLETLENGCCDHIVSDGLGGVWMIGRVGEDRLHLWHITAQGIIDGTEAFDPPPGTGGIAVAFDPGTMTFWMVQSRDSVTPIRIRTDESIGS
jgi:hypothetical protein